MQALETPLLQFW